MSFRGKISSFFFKIVKSTLNLQKTARKQIPEIFKLFKKRLNRFGKIEIDPSCFYTGDQGSVFFQTVFFSILTRK